MIPREDEECLYVCQRQRWKAEVDRLNTEIAGHLTRLQAAHDEIARLRAKLKGKPT
jgi:hypothetical protein